MATSLALPKEAAGQHDRTNIHEAAAPVTEYPFTDVERAFFKEGLDDLNFRTQALNRTSALICAQQGLTGRWQLKPDASGLVKAPEQAPA